MSSAPDPNQCAVDSNGNLLRADQIVFYNDPDDPTPLAPVSEGAIMQAHQSDPPADQDDGNAAGNSTGRRRSNRRGAGSILSFPVAEEKRNEHGHLKAKFSAGSSNNRATHKARVSGTRKDQANPEEGDGEDDCDEDFEGGNETESDEESYAEGVDNNEVLTTGPGTACSPRVEKIGVFWGRGDRKESQRDGTVLQTMKIFSSTRRAPPSWASAPWKLPCETLLTMVTDAALSNEGTGLDPSVSAVARATLNVSGFWEVIVIEATTTMPRVFGSIFR
ncbi:hypothetical protein DFP72DRAFT_848562 [Ephemerocybe angulata]|uniref:Uncharacterized protein n=1 Tax=Ephemerocybe angulata TaxID=980116 RepID=A0A8H6HW30_9AGAR|nr:hypothetical protein DFP72DRAFT_848562 [Tulosesus angulatus]